MPLRSITLQRCLLWFLALVMMLGGSAMVHAEDSMSSDTFTTMINNSLDQVASDTTVNVCTTDPKTLLLWNYTATYDFEQRIVAGTTILCPKDFSSTSTDTTWIGSNSGSGNDYTGKILLQYSPCRTPVTADSSNAGYSCPSTSQTPILFSLAANECTTVYDTKFCALRKGTNVCAYVPEGSVQIPIGCMGLSVSTTADAPSALACFMPRLCYDDSAWSASQNDFSISGPVVQCVTMAVKALLFGERPASAPDGTDFFDTTAITTTLSGQEYINTCSSNSLFDNIQTALRGSVFLALSLYVVLWGFQYIMAAAGGGRLTSKGEFVKRIVTVSLVIFFATGPAWKTYFPVLLDITQVYSQKFLNATTTAVVDQATGDTSAATTYCQFQANQYDAGYETFALWDTLDCKLKAYFFGDEDFPKIITLGFASILVRPDVGIFILLFTLVFAFFVAGIVVSVVEIFFTSMIGLAINLFLSPIFIPMALFNVTKGYFNNWLREIISLTLNPVLMFGFVGVCLGLIDVFMLGDMTKNQFNDNTTISFVQRC